MWHSCEDVTTTFAQPVPWSIYLKQIELSGIIVVDAFAAHDGLQSVGERAAQRIY